MTDILKAAKLTNDLTEYRDGVRALLGGRYEAAITPYRHVIRGIAAANGFSILDAGLDLSKKMESAGHDPGFAIAAMVDEMEQTK